MALKAVRGTPFVYHVQDLWPHTVMHSGFLTGGSSRIERTLHAYCDLLYAAADTVAVTSPGMAAHVADRGVPAGKIELVPNWADEESFRPVEPDPALRAQFGLDRRFWVMYAGIFGGYQQLDVLVRAAEALRHRQDIGVALVGGGVVEGQLRRQVADAGLDNVRFVPFQPFSRMADVLALGDVQLVSLADLPLFHSTLPSKLQATLAAGRPLIGAVSGDAAAVVEQSGAGVLVQPGSVEDMVAAVEKFAGAAPEELAERGRRGRAFYLANYSEAVAVGRLSSLLERAAARRNR
jgi:glycosyltransferase involved in cell wall biosynthesis